MAEWDTDKKAVCLRDWGFQIGPRDPRLNTDYPGAFMVVEDDYQDQMDGLGITTTDDGRVGPWCVVGDNLADLIAEAYEIWEADHDAYKP